MAFPTNCFELIVIASVSNQYVNNVLHFQPTATLSGTPLQQAESLATAWQSTVEAAWLACLPSDYTLAGYHARLAGPPGSATYVLASAPGTVGTRGGVSTLSGVGPVLAFPANNPFAPHRKWETGKIFMPGLAAGDMLSNEFVISLLTACGTLIDLLLDPIVDSGNSFIYTVASNATGNMTNPSGGFVSMQVGTQRRRYHPVL